MPDKLFEDDSDPLIRLSIEKGGKIRDLTDQPPKAPAPEQKEKTQVPPPEPTGPKEAPPLRHKPPTPDSAAARYERAMEGGEIVAPLPAPVREKPEEPPVASLYEKATEPVPPLSPPSFRDWADKLDEADLSAMDGPVQDSLRVVRSDRKFPHDTEPGSMVVYLQSLRVTRRVIDTAVEAFKVYEGERDMLSV